MGGCRTCPAVSVIVLVVRIYPCAQTDMYVRSIVRVCLARGALLICSLAFLHRYGADVVEIRKPWGQVFTRETIRIRAHTLERIPTVLRTNNGLAYPQIIHGLSSNMPTRVYESMERVLASMVVMLESTGVILKSN